MTNVKFNLKGKDTIVDIATFERKVFEVDGIAIRIRAPLNTQVADFNFVRAAPSMVTIAEWLKIRIKPLVGKFECDCIFVGYEHGTFHGSATLGSARQLTGI